MRIETVRETLFRLMREEVQTLNLSQNAASRLWGVDLSRVHTLFKWLESGDPTSLSLGTKGIEHMCNYYQLALQPAAPRKVRKPRPIKLRKHKMWGATNELP